MSQSIDQRDDLDRLDLDEIKRFLRRRWRFVLATAFGCAVVAAGICLSITPTYKATSQVLLDPRRQHVFGTDQAGTDSSLDSSVVDSQIPIILSTRLLAKVIAQQHLTEDAEFASPKRQGILDRIVSIFRPAKPVNIDAPSFDHRSMAVSPFQFGSRRRADMKQAMWTTNAVRVAAVKGN